MSELQGNEEWIKARLGKATASRISDVVTKTKNGWGASRANYMAELIIERLTEKQADQHISGPMKWGTDTQPEALAAYSFWANVDVGPVGFVPHPKIDMSGASPDGLIGKTGLVEVKCPNTATHLATLLGASIDGGYVIQMQWQMACTGRKWCDWLSFDPRLPEKYRRAVRRVKRDDEVIANLEKEVKVFLSEIDQKIATLEKQAE